MGKVIKVLSFDLDDTLWPNYPTILRAEKKLFQWLSEHVPEITHRYDLIQLREKRKTILTEHPELSHNLTQLRILSFERLADEFSLDTDWIVPAFDIFYEARQQVTLYDDVASALDELREKYRLVSLTNGNASTVKTGVDHWFDISLNSEKVGQSKARPGIYQRVMKMTGAEASQMVHIGDDPVNDVSGAKMAGISAIWLNRDNRIWSVDTCEPDAVITSLDELPRLLTKLDNLG